MARPRVLDTTILIARLRGEPRAQGLRTQLASGQYWISSVSLAELYAGTRFQLDALAVDRIRDAMSRIGRLLTPTEAEWVLAGRLLARRVRQVGAMRPRDHLEDLLILLGAARLRGAVVTANTRHLEHWARLVRAAGLDVVVLASLEAADP